MILSFGLHLISTRLYRFHVRIHSKANILTKIPVGDVDSKFVGAFLMAHAIIKIRGTAREGLGCLNDPLCLGRGVVDLVYRVLRDESTN